MVWICEYLSIFCVKCSLMQMGHQVLALLCFREQTEMSLESDLCKGCMWMWNKWPYMGVVIVTWYCSVNLSPSGLLRLCQKSIKARAIFHMFSLWVHVDSRATQIVHHVDSLAYCCFTSLLSCDAISAEVCQDLPVSGWNCLNIMVQHDKKNCMRYALNTFKNNIP